jgi:hypothetical protein
MMGFPAPRMCEETHKKGAVRGRVGQGLPKRSNARDKKSSISRSIVTSKYVTKTVMYVIYSARAGWNCASTTTKGFGLLPDIPGI